MKRRRVAFVGIFCIAILMVFSADAKKPPRPGDTAKECFVFTGDLEGSQVVEDCCPNAGPFPAYAKAF